MTLTEELIEYTKRDPYLVQERTKTAVVELAWLWEKYKDDPIAFYRDSDLYIFDLTNYQEILKKNGFHTGIFENTLKNFNIKTLLDYGGGIGEYTILADKLGIKTTYQDVQFSKTMDYAKYRFAKHGINPNILFENDRIGHYDMIVAMDIFEHLPNPQPLITELSKRCKYIICNMPGELPYGPIYPQHISQYNLFGDFNLIAPYVYQTKYLPKVSIIIPQLGREDGLKRCLDSIDRLDYPRNLIQTLVIRGEETVPEKVATGLTMADADSDYIVYGANDMEFEPSSLRIAVLEDRNQGLVAFGGHEVLPDRGNACEHFIIHRELILDLGGEIFDREFHHTGVDNLLLAKAEKLNRAIISKTAKVIHHHFARNESAMDEVYQKGWSMVEKDRELLKQKLEKLNA